LSIRRRVESRELTRRESDCLVGVREVTGSGVLLVCFNPYVQQRNYNSQSQQPQMRRESVRVGGHVVEEVQDGGEG